ncbi:MAG TPA: nuclear transport factor 2 family protein [Steroidobacteraceae bacterium]|nr:nuclear transport factor 2 family protein [Steroidobacteraceae bacterium]
MTTTARTARDWQRSSGNTIRRICSDSTRTFDRRRKVTGREEFIATFTSPALKLDPFEVLDRRYIDLGKDAGIVAGEAILRGTEDGKAFVEHIRYADTFARRDGRWQVVYVQVTPLPS